VVLAGLLPSKNSSLPNGMVFKSFEERFKNIGWLHKDIVALVVKFYGYLGYINSLQNMRGHYISVGKDFDTQYEGSLKRLLDDFGGKFDRRFAGYHIADLGQPGAHERTR